MTPVVAVIAVYLLVNLVSFITYYRDKRLAERSAWRIPEKRLLTLAFFGPFGAFAAMRMFRHKTQKRVFRLPLPMPAPYAGCRAAPCRSLLIHPSSIRMRLT